MAQIEVFTTRDRLDLHHQFGEAFANSWPDFIFHDPVSRTYLPAVQESFSHLDVTLVLDGVVVAGGWGVSLAWDETPEDLPGGYDDALVRSLSGDDRSAHDTLSIMAVAVHPRYRGRALSAAVMRELRERASQTGLTRVIAPVRPTLKASYPLTPMATFARWRRDDGEHLDPWIRAHERLGSRVLGTAPESMIITGTVREWESWTHMAFPETGAYVVPEALDLVAIDRERDTGVYVEPNLWMRHA